MGHYDDCYASAAEEQRTRAIKNNKKVLNESGNLLHDLFLAVDKLTISERNREHLEDKLTEFDALLQLLVGRTLDSDD